MVFTVFLLSPNLPTGSVLSQLRKHFIKVGIGYFFYSYKSQVLISLLS